MNNWSNFIQNVLYPPICLLCGEAGDNGRDLCLACQSEFPVIEHACRRCAAPLPDAMAARSLCGECLRNPPEFDRATALFRYDGVARHVLLGFKFGQRMACCKVLSDLLQDRVAGLTPKPTRLIPMPMHRRRYRQRGFNQALEIASNVGKGLAIPVEHRARRVRATVPQTGLSGIERRRNLRGAFAVDVELTGESVAIVDDVVTTGTSVNELARTLKRAGASEVSVWAIARA